MLLQTNSYIVPPDKRSEHLRLVRRFRQTLARLGCDHFEVYEQVGANWGSAESAGRFVQILRFVDRKHQLAVQSAERTDPGAQAVIAEFCELINFPYQQEQGLFAVSFYSGVLPPISKRAGQDEPGSAAESASAEDGGGAARAMPSGEVTGEAVMDAGVSAKTAAESDELKPAELEPAELEHAEFESADLEPAELDPAEPESAELEPTALEPPITPAVAEPASGFVPIEDELDRTLESRHSREADESPRMGHMKLVQGEPADEPVDGKLAEAETYGRIQPAAIEPAAEAEPLEEFEHSEFEHSEFEHPEIEQIEELEPEEEEEFTPVSSIPVSSTPVSNGHAVLHEPEPEIRPIGESLGELAEEDDFHLMPEPQTLSAFTPELPAEHAAEAEAEPMHHESLLTSEHESAEELVSTDELSPVVSDEVASDEVASDEVVSDEPVEIHPAHHPRHEDDFMTLIQGELTEEDEERAHGFIEGELVDDLENEHLNGLSGHVKHADELTGHEVRPPKQNAPW